MDSPIFYIGRNQAQLNGKVLHLKLIGPYLAEPAREILTLADRIYREQGMLFMLLDVSQSIPPTPEVRKLVATWPVAGRYAVLTYGAGILHRTAMLLILSANRLLSRSLAPDVLFFSSEAAARAWIAKHPHGGAAST